MILPQIVKASSRPFLLKRWLCAATEISARATRFVLGGEAAPLIKHNSFHPRWCVFYVVRLTLAGRNI